MKLVEIRDLDTEEILIRIAELKEEHFNLRFQMATGQLDNHRRIRAVKREIARLKTVLREREIQAFYEYEAAAKASASSGAEGSTEADAG
jgi:large subunit ribosomal protein L29